jgi:hypothetical protein
MSYTLVLRFSLAMAIIVMNAADVVTTRALIDAGGSERNPIAGHFLEQGSLVVVKIGLAGVIGVLMLIAPLRRRCESFVWFAVVAFATVVTLPVGQLTIVMR